MDPKPSKKMSGPEKDKLEQLYIMFKRHMIKVAMVYLHNIDDAEDAVSETILKIAENISRVPDADNPKAKGYLSIATANTSINMLANPERKNISLEELGDQFPDTMSVEDEYIEKEEHETVFRMINSMGGTQRDVLKLRYLCEMSVREIADTLGITYHAAAKRLERAEDELIETYHDWEVE